MTRAIATSRILRCAAATFALLALALLCLASVQSSIMQTAMAFGQSTPMCGLVTTGPSALANPWPSPAKPGKAHKACPICALASSHPLTGQAPALVTSPACAQATVS